MTTNYERGRNFEYQRMRHYKSLGYTVVRSAGSHSPIDLVAIHPEDSVILIQCKRVKTQSQADRMLKDFNKHPPLKVRNSQTADPTYVQRLEVYVSDLRQVVSTEVAW